MIENENENSGGVCVIQHKPCKLKTPNVIVKLIQRYNPKPISNACVRYDVEHKMWALLDPKDNYKVLQHFTMGVIENVRFETLPMNDSMRMIACYQSNNPNIGLAHGDLYLHKSSNDMIGAHNLAFKEGGFFNEDNEKMTLASKVVLMSDRRAVYFK